LNSSVRPHDAHSGYFALTYNLLLFLWGRQLKGVKNFGGETLLKATVLKLENEIWDNMTICHRGIYYYRRDAFITPTKRKIFFLPEDGCTLVPEDGDVP